LIEGDSRLVRLQVLANVNLVEGQTILILDPNVKMSVDFSFYVVAKSENLFLLNEPFEVFNTRIFSSLTETPMQLKENGNKLMTAKAYFGAIYTYGTALAILHQQMSEEKYMYGLSPEAIDEMNDLIMVLHGNTS